MAYSFLASTAQEVRVHHATSPSSFGINQAACLSPLTAPLTEQHAPQVVAVCPLSLTTLPPDRPDVLDPLE